MAAGGHQYPSRLVRVARTLAAFSNETVAEVCGTSNGELIEVLRGGRGRGRCAEAAAASHKHAHWAAPAGVRRCSAWWTAPDVAGVAGPDRALDVIDSGAGAGVAHGVGAALRGAAQTGAGGASVLP